MATGKKNGEPPRIPRSPGVPRNPEAAARRDLLSSVDRIYRDARGFATSLDLLAIEGFASGVASMWYGDGSSGETDSADEATVAVATLLAERVAAKRTPDALALLIAIQTFAPPEHAAALAPWIARLRASNVADPPWVFQIGRASLAEGWRSGDEFGDEAMLMAVFERPGHPSHGLGLHVDHNMGGMARNVFLIEQPESARGDWLARSGFPIESLTAQEVADEFAAALQALDETWEPDVPSEALYLLPLVRVRLRLLPAPRPLQRREFRQEEREALLAQFLASPEAAPPPGSRRRAVDREIAVLASFFIDYACDYAGDPFRVSPTVVEILMLDWLPRRTLLEPAQVKALPEALRRWAQYAGRRRGLSEAAIEETIAAVGPLEGEFGRAVRDSATAPGAALFRSMRDEGVDVGDPGAVERWMAGYRARPFEERMRLSGGPGARPSPQGRKAPRPQEPPLDPPPDNVIPIDRKRPPLLN